MIIKDLVKHFLISSVQACGRSRLSAEILFLHWIYLVVPGYCKVLHSTGLHDKYGGLVIISTEIQEICDT